MISNLQSLILCGILVGGIFVCGLLGLLDNYIVKTILVLIFLVILTNIFVVYSKQKKDEENGIN
jgi:hypothetical protein